MPISVIPVVFLAGIALFLAEVIKCKNSLNHKRRKEKARNKESYYCAKELELTGSNVPEAAVRNLPNEGTQIAESGSSGVILQ